MKIGFDAKRAFANSTGLGNYSRWVIRSFAQQYPEHELFLFAPESNNDLFNIEDLFQNVNIITPDSALGKMFPSFWRTYAIANICNELQLDVYHGLSNELPVGIDGFRGKKVVTIHDLIFLRYPGYYSNIDRYIYKKKFQYASNVADHIVAASRQTADDITAYFGTDAYKISVVYQDCDERFKKVNNGNGDFSTLKAKYGIDTNFILTVGTIEQRKNQLSLVKAFLKADLDDIKLMVVGKRTSYADELDAFISQNNLSEKVKILDNVQFEDLPLLYKLAKGFAYVSEFEGFGIPLLEAMQINTPILTANTSSLVEVAGDAALYCNPHDVEGMAKQLNKLINDSVLREKLRTNALKQLEKFDRQLLMNQLLHIYQR